MNVIFLEANVDHRYMNEVKSTFVIKGIIAISKVFFNSSSPGEFFTNAHFSSFSS